LIVIIVYSVIIRTELSHVIVYRWSSSCYTATHRHSFWIVPFFVWVVQSALS